MDSIISLGQKNTLDEYMILSGADNRPPMLDKDLTKKYAELSAVEKIQAYCDMKATNIILQGLPADIYSLINHHRVAKDLRERVQLLMQVIPQVTYQSPQAPTQLMTESPFVDSGFAVPIFSPRDDLIACLNKAMMFLTAVASSRFPSTNNQLRTSFNPQNQATIQDGRVTVQQVRGDNGKLILKAGQILDEERLAFLADLGILVGQAQTIIPHNAAFQTEDFDTYDSDCDDLSNAQSKAQRIKPTLYDGIVISEKHVAMPVIDDKETLILEEKSRSKMSKKAKDPEVIAKKTSHKPIDYEKLNRLTDDFGKRFTPQQELSAEQAFWLGISNPTIEPYLPSIRVEVPSELPKVSLVNESLKKLKFQLAQFDSVVKKRTTPNALTEGEWGFEHTKAIFNNDIIPFLKSFKNIFNVFDKDLLNEITKRSESYEKCLNLDVEYSKSKQEYNDLLKRYSQLKKHCISLEVSMQLKQEVFQNDESCVYQNAPEIPEYFEKNDLIAQLKDKDTTIYKLKDTIKSLRKNNKKEIVDHDRCDRVTINEELENSVAKLLSENERICKKINHVKQVFKDQFDSIKQTRVLQKEQRVSLINKLNLKSAENEDLKAQIQDKVFVITTLKNDLRKLKGKATVDNAAQIPSVITVPPGMFKLDFEPLAPKLVHNRESHSYYLKHTQEQADIL
nr:hypothetical protein [Tanacetum cinerariifolium]